MTMSFQNSAEMARTGNEHLSQIHARIARGVLFASGKQPRTKDDEKTLQEIIEDTEAGFAFIRKYPNTISILGSARPNMEPKFYQWAEELGGRFATDGYAVATGGGPGIMQAANKGAKEAGGVSLGFNISLPHEPDNNPYLTDGVEFRHMHVRQNMLLRAGKAHVVFPGGFGTFYELADALTQMQTGQVPKVPVVLVGSEFWSGFVAWAKEQMEEGQGTISPGDLELVKIVDSVDEAHEYISKNIR